MYAFTREHIRSDLLVSAHACMYLLVNEHVKTPALHLHIQEKKIFQTMKRSKRGHTTATICSFYLSAKIFIQHNAKHEHHTTPHQSQCPLQAFAQAQRDRKAAESREKANKRKRPDSNRTSWSFFTLFYMYSYSQPDRQISIRD